MVGLGFALWFTRAAKSKNAASADIRLSRTADRCKTSNRKAFSVSIERGSMISVSHAFLVTAALFAPALLRAQASELSVMSELRSLATATTPQPPAMVIKIASDIRALPAGQRKLQLADGLAHLASRDDPGQKAIQAVADTLAQSLAEFPLSDTGDQPPAPYTDLAKLIRYEHVTTTLDYPFLAKAIQKLVADDADVERADFTLKDLQGQDVTLSRLRGKVVLVNFWATWCGPCRLELPDLNDFYSRFKSQGLVVLSITNEESLKVSSFVNKTGYRAPVLLDSESQAAKRFHVENLPRSFVFNRKGKLVALAVDQRSRRQFFQMLAAAGLRP
jgi:peroxiredoxin